MKTIAIFGGSGGLGLASAESLARDYKLVIGYNNNKNKADSFCKNINKDGYSARAIKVNIDSIDSVKSFLESSNSENDLSGVINAVGPPIPLKPLCDISEDEFKSILSIDVFGAFNVLKESFIVLSKLGGGSIVQFLTTAVLKTLENDGMSGIPKTAIMGIVRQFAREVKDTNVRINAVAPGVIDAGIVHSSFTADKTAQEVIEMCLNRTPMPRMGKPSEVSELVKFLLDERAGYINGQIIGVDGGYSA
tara:strand:- start:2038 stop:2784 length:747 start_codon:yes stop_codon:yes gene_type:complete